jgi:hypothetical protein
MGVLRISTTSMKDRPFIGPRTGWLDRCPRIQYLIQWIRNGFPDSDIWNLDWSIAKYTLPRLKRLKEIQCGFPGDLGSMEEWDEIIDKIILAFDKIANSEPPTEDCKEIKEGLDLFRKYYFSLWD